MKVIARILRRFAREEEGAALVEYGLLVGLIAVACIAAITDVGAAVNELFVYLAGKLGDIPMP